MSSTHVRDHIRDSSSGSESSRGLEVGSAAGFAAVLTASLPMALSAQRAEAFVGPISGPDSPIVLHIKDHQNHIEQLQVTEGSPLGVELATTWAEYRARISAAAEKWSEGQAEYRSGVDDARQQMGLDRERSDKLREILTSYQNLSQKEIRATLVELGVLKEDDEQQPSPKLVMQAMRETIGGTSQHFDALKILRTDWGVTQAEAWADAQASSLTYWNALASRSDGGLEVEKLRAEYMRTLVLTDHPARIPASDLDVCEFMQRPENEQVLGIKGVRDVLQKYNYQLVQRFEQEYSESRIRERFRREAFVDGDVRVKSNPSELTPEEWQELEARIRFDLRDRRLARVNHEALQEIVYLMRAAEGQLNQGAAEDFALAVDELLFPVIYETTKTDRLFSQVESALLAQPAEEASFDSLDDIRSLRDLYLQERAGRHNVLREEFINGISEKAIRQYVDDYLAVYRYAKDTRWRIDTPIEEKRRMFAKLKALEENPTPFDIEQRYRSEEAAAFGQYSDILSHYEE